VQVGEVEHDPDERGEAGEEPKRERDERGELDVEEFDYRTATSRAVVAGPRAVSEGVRR